MSLFLLQSAHGASHAHPRRPPDYSGNAAVTDMSGATAYAKSDGNDTTVLFRLATGDRIQAGPIPSPNQNARAPIEAPVTSSAAYISPASVSGCDRIRSEMGCDVLHKNGQYSSTFCTGDHVIFREDVVASESAREVAHPIPGWVNPEAEFTKSQVRQVNRILRDRIRDNSTTCRKFIAFCKYRYAVLKKASKNKNAAQARLNKREKLMLARLECSRSRLPKHPHLKTVWREMFTAVNFYRELPENYSVRERQVLKQINNEIATKKMFEKEFPSLLCDSTGELSPQWKLIEDLQSLLGDILDSYNEDVVCAQKVDDTPLEYFTFVDEFCNDAVAITLPDKTTPYQKERQVRKKARKFIRDYLKKKNVTEPKHRESDTGDYDEKRYEWMVIQKAKAMTEEALRVIGESQDKTIDLQHFFDTFERSGCQEHETGSVPP